LAHTPTLAPKPPELIQKRGAGRKVEQPASRRPGRPDQHRFCAVLERWEEKTMSKYRGEWSATPWLCFK